MIIELEELVKNGEIEIKTGPFGTQLKAAEYVESGTPVLNVKNLGYSTVVTTKVDYVGEKTLERLSMHILKEGDIVFGRKGAVDRHAYIGANEAGWMQGSDCIRLRVKTNKINPRYLSYYFLTPKHKAFMISMCSHGTTMASLNQGILSKIEIDLPERCIQDRIVSIIAVLDKKRKTNEKLNKNLEQQAQAIYSRMFIEHRQESWSTGQLSDLISVKYGKDHKKLADGNYPVYGSGGIMRYVEKPLYTGESVLIPRKGTLNNIMYVNEAFWSVDTMFYTEMLRPNIAKFVYHFVKSKDLASLNAGSAVPSMTTNILNAMQLYIPDEKTLEKFENIVSPMYSAMQENTKESKILANTRDALLPKLMSGELDVSDIDL
ncbi:MULTISPECIES: restriction endonuclease subunit S [unclassified Ruminococcus]|uniref:restriction endonuclease subunit S n=2 Tax=Ruminococcus TaxID=1263 RepID=UPI0008216A52|nr:restriction endonuclease subunit S [Ruminococcus sp. 1001136sp1]MDB8772590.1 restriction endonuclease subunit S [Ruminococcus sp. 1001136sp1]SCJ88444.1 EcoKI restriction-modification system protein HsdS [uncultured Clostridium sp.]